MISAAVGFQCPVCAGQMREGALGEVTYRAKVRAERAPLLRNISGAQIATILIGVNVVVFILEALGGLDARSAYRFGAMTSPLPASDWWRMITAMFVHFSVLHLAFNMFALVLFAGTIEQRYGKLRFLGLYLGSGVMGSAMSLAFTGAGISGGASGAVFGIMGAFLAVAIMHRNSTAMRGQMQSWIVMIGLNLLLSVSVPNVDLHDHLGGLIGGFAIGLGLEFSQTAKGSARHAIQAAGYLVVAVAAYVVASPHLL